MSVLIGHSSIDENGKAHSGSAGDQTTKEVCTRTWYEKSWNVVLRCTDSAMAEKMAKLCEQACANNKIGYDQWQRNTLYTQAKKVNFDLSKITTACECDCSSLMCICAIGAGIPEKYLFVNGNMKTTRTMRAAFKNTGKFEVLTESKYLTSDQYLMRGDIIIEEGSHTVMVLSNGSKVLTIKPVSKENKQYSGKGIGVATAKSNMNVRSGSSTSHKIVGSCPKNAKVEVLEILSNGWYKIVWPGASVGYAYVSNKSNKYFTYTAKKVDNSFKVKITASALRVRAGAGTSYKTITYVHKNETYTIIEEKVVKGIRWGRLSNGKGWISLRYSKQI